MGDTWQPRKRYTDFAAMMDPHTAAELDLQQIWDLTDALLAAHGDWLPEFARTSNPRKAA